MTRTRCRLGTLTILLLFLAPASLMAAEGRSGSTQKAPPPPGADSTRAAEPDDSNPPAIQVHDEAMDNQGTETSRNWSFHLSFGAYKLSEFDSEFSGGDKPNHAVLGGGNELIFLAGIERMLWQGVGIVGLEAEAGIWRDKGKGLYADGTHSQEATAFSFIPMKLSVSYRFDWLQKTYQVPLAPYAKLGFDYYLWWIEKDNGDLASYKTSSGKSQSGIGGTFGFHVTYGLAFCLDFLDPRLARDFDHDFGVNNTYLFVEGSYSKINDFWAGSSFDLSDHAFLGGLLLEF